MPVADMLESRDLCCWFKPPPFLVFKKWGRQEGVLSPYLKLIFLLEKFYNYI